jgi:YD repeat-containing protein
MNRVVTEVNYEEDTKGVRQTVSTVTHSYDGFGRETSVKTVDVNGDTEQSRTEYDANGSVISATDSDGITTQNVYNEMN